MLTRVISVAIAILIVGVVANDTSNAQVPAAKSKKLLKQIIEDWENRRQEISSVSVQICNTRFDRLPVTVDQNGKFTMLDTPDSFVVNSYLVLKGENVRFEQFGLPVRGDEREFVIIDTFDGVTETTFSPICEANPDYPKGWITTREFSAIGGTLYQPLFVHFVTHVESMAQFALEDLEIENTHSFICGNSRIVLSVDGVDPGVHFHLWIAPEKQHSVVRIDRYMHGRLHTHTNINVEQNKNCHWIPIAWDFTTVDENGKVVRRSEVRVVTTQTNKANQDDFRITFPVGTIVMDMRPSPKNQTGSFTYLLKENGEKREVTWNERSVEYDVLKRTESGKGHLWSQQISQLRTWLVYLLPCCGLVVLLYMVNRTKNKERGQ